MPTKTDLVLENLPFTFRPAVRSSALRAVVGAIGDELQAGENSLARIMRAHWVDTADKNAIAIEDLARIASMYGLSPLRDNEGKLLETVEQFREHLKRHVSTLLEGTVTVPGLLRLAADILGLNVAIGREELDAWWTRTQPELVTTAPRGEDAAGLLFGIAAFDSRGVDEQPAQIVGTVDLTAGADLRTRSVLRLQIDEHGPFAVDLAQGAAEPSRVPLEHIRNAINLAFPETVARDDGKHLIVESIKQGPEGRIEIEDHDDDASSAVLGLPPLVYTGRDATSAQARSRLDLSSGADPATARYLRIVIDAAELAEIDCAQPGSQLVVLDDIKNRINTAFGREMATHDGRFLTIQSPNTGTASSVFLQEPAAQNLAQALLGTPIAFFLGTDAQGAVASGVADLSKGVDLSERSLVRVRVDALPPITINCAGADPSKTTLEEIVAFLNAALGPGTATTDGRRIRLVSHTSGRQGQIVFEPAGDNDALPKVFGFGPRVFRGTASLPATFAGHVDLSGGVNLLAQHLIGLSMDGGEVQEIDLAAGKQDPSDVRPAELVDAINKTFPKVAFTDGRRLQLTSQAPGSASRISIVPLETMLRRRFTTRATILDEASLQVLGFTARRAVGDESTPARVVGAADLSFGVDLSQEQWLSISINSREVKEINCAGPRPRSTTLEEIVESISQKLAGEPVIVAHDRAHVILVTSSTGSGSAILFHPVTVQDAAKVLGIPYGESRGGDAARVVFVGTVDLSKGLDLAPDARIKVAVDGDPPVEISLNPATAPQRRTLNEIVVAINSALNASIASHDGNHIILSSRLKGGASRLLFEAPTGTDAAKAVFGIEVPRLYQAQEASRAEIQSTDKIKDPLDLRVSRFLQLSVDGGPAKVVDCASQAAKAEAVTLNEIVNALNTAIGGVAEEDDDYLIIHSNTLGSASRVSVLPYVAGDARGKVLGNIPPKVQGSDASPAVITGDVSLLEFVDLRRSRKLRLSIDDGRPVEVDIAGAVPAKTVFTEILDAINAVQPGVASLTNDGKLRLISPGRGENSSIEVHARRHLELIEYPPEVQHHSLGPVSHGHQFSLRNRGAAEVAVRIVLDSDKGVVDPVLANHSAGLALTVLEVIRAGDRLMIYSDEVNGLRARLESPQSLPRVLEPAKLRLQRISTSATGSNPLLLSRGTSHWTYLECTGARFNEARFNADHFAGEPCTSLGIFDVSRLDGAGGYEASIYWPPPPHPEPSVRLSFSWQSHRLGAFELNLPAELPSVFGGRFNEARFGLGSRSEKFERIVFEPRNDPDYIVTRISGISTLVEPGDTLNNVPLGFVEQLVPFRKPRFLSLGDAGREAAIYLVEESSPEIIELKAVESGDWGNSISVSVRPDGPGRYQVEVFFEGDRFEGARDLVAGGAPEVKLPVGPDLPACAKRPLPALIAPSPGVLQAKAAGVRARVTRDRTGET